MTTGRLRATVVIAFAVCGFVLGPGAAGSSHRAEAGTVTPSCNGGSCAPWFRADVTLRWSWSPGELETVNCDTRTFTSDMRDLTSCTVTWQNGSTTTTTKETAEIKLDKTPPAVTSARPDRTPDVHGWYNRPVLVQFGGSDAMSDIAACSSVEYAGPDAGAATITGGCRDVAGNTAQTSVGLAYDATAPAARAVPDRPPDSNGWYTRPTSVAFEGSDPVSGVESCTSARYDGPDSGVAAVSGSCTDRAGNTATLTAPLLYDATPPSLDLTRVLVAQRSATIEWSASPDAAHVAVARSPGPGGAVATELFSGNGTTFTDTAARRRIEYRYTVRALDPAGHPATKTVAVVPGVGVVLRPGDDASIVGPPLLRWPRNGRADYYNVQLHRVPGPPVGGDVASGGGRKIATSWPRTTRLKLRRSWRSGRRKERLLPGYYSWYVWPGYGSKESRRYGPLAGKGTFRVVR